MIEAILFLAFFYGGIYVLYKIGEFISQQFSLHRERIRDEVANEVLSGGDTVANVAKYKQVFSEFQNPSEDDSEFEGTYWYRQPYSELLGRCPDCHKGYLQIRNGKYGKFIGCGSYPRCKYTINIKKARAERKERVTQEFVQVMKNAYN